MQQITYPIGEQDFAAIRTDGQLYVDKTEYVYKLVSADRRHFLSRPRRFGKSLLVSTLKYFFEGRRELFEGLAIDRLLPGPWQAHPVLLLDISNGKYNPIDNLRSMLNSILKDYEDQYGLTPEPMASYGTRLKEIIQSACRATGQQVVVLIDEYDAPMLDAIDDEQRLEDVRNIMRDLWSPLKAQAQHLRFIFITGITKFSQMSIFSELNNLNDLSLLPQYEAICGITEQELATQLRPGIEAMAGEWGITAEQMMAELKALYDGYHFSDEMTADIYNPYSVIKALSNRKLQHYWFASGTPTWLIGLLRRFGVTLSDLDDIETVESSFDKPVERVGDYVPVLYQSGYLTIKNFARSRPIGYLEGIYTLGIPNREVRVGLGKLMSDINAETRTVDGWLCEAAAEAE